MSEGLPKKLFFQQRFANNLDKYEISDSLLEAVIKLNVQLFGILADHLPREDKGKASVELADSSTFRDLTEKLGIRRKVTFAVNGEHDLDESHVLEDGDEVLVFTSVGGG